MAMYSIRLDGDTRAMLRRIRSFSEIDKQGINAALAEGVRESTLERFKQSKDPDGRRWKTSIRAAQEGGKTLIQQRPGRAQMEDLHPRRTGGRQDAHPVRAAPQLHPRQVGHLRLRARHERQVCGDASVRRTGPHHPGAEEESPPFSGGRQVGHEEASPHHHPGPSLPRSLRGRYAGDEGDGRGVHPEGGLISCSTRKASNISSTS